MSNADRWNDSPDDRYRDEPRRDPIAAAKGKVIGPAIGLIAAGVLGLCMVAYGFVSMATLPAQLAQANAQFENDPKLNAQQKQAARDAMKAYENMIRTVLPITFGLNTIVSLLVIFGGVQILTLSSRGFGMIASIIAMIPCVNGCCQWAVAVPFAIWALIVLSNPVVKAGFAAKAGGGSPDADYR